MANSTWLDSKVTAWVSAFAVHLCAGTWLLQVSKKLVCVELWSTQVVRWAALGGF